jgi:hypothetical protein
MQGVSLGKARNGQERVWGARLPRRRGRFCRVLCPERRARCNNIAGTADAAKDLIRLPRGPDPFCELNLLARFKKGALTQHGDDIGNTIFSCSGPKVSQSPKSDRTKEVVTRDVGCGN